MEKEVIYIECVQHYLLGEDDGNNSIEAVDLRDNGSFYNYHYFIIKLWIDQSPYTVARNCISFFELDTKLRKHYTRSVLPTLPFGQGVVKKSPSQKFKSRYLQSVSSMSSSANNDCQEKRFNHSAGNFSRKNLIKCVDNDMLSNKVDSINKYFESLLTEPEIVSSDLLVNFFDEELLFGSQEEFEYLKSEELSDVEFLLHNEETVQITVRREHKVTLDGNKGDYIVYKFSTQQRDVGFSLLFKGSEVSAYQRYNSHVKEQKGVFQLPDDGSIELLWDNSYSKMRSKSLRYILKFCREEEVQVARSLHADANKEKVRFAKQRAILAESLDKKADSLLIKKGLSSPSAMRQERSSIYDRNFIDVESLTNDNEKLHSEKTALLKALEASESLLANEQENAKSRLKEIEDLKSANIKLEDELKYAKLEGNKLSEDIEGFKFEMKQSEIAYKGIPSNLEDIEEYFESIKRFACYHDQSQCPGKVEVLFAFLKSYIDSHSKKDQNEDELINQMKDQITKLKIEKKQLKLYALESRKAMKDYQSTIEELEHERDLNRKEMQKSSSKKDSISIQNPVSFDQWNVYEDDEFATSGNDESETLGTQKKTPNMLDVNEKDVLFGAPPTQVAEILYSKIFSKNENDNSDSVDSKSEEFALEKNENWREEMRAEVRGQVRAISSMLPTWDQILGIEEDSEIEKEASHLPKNQNKTEDNFTSSSLFGF